MLSAALSLALCRRPAAQSQQENPGQPNPDSDQAAPQDNPPPSQEDKPAEPASASEEKTEPAPAASAEMSQEDAVINFPTVVSSFISDRSPKGYWPLKDKATGQIMKLKLVKVDAEYLRQSGPNNFSGSAVLADIQRKTRLKVEFAVDFSGAEWKVTGMRILAKSTPKPKAAKKPRQAPAGSPKPAP